MADEHRSDRHDGPKPPERWHRIEAKLLATKALLARSGGVVKRRLGDGRSVWVIRFREQVAGECRQRAIYLGDEILARQARELIARWRVEAITPQQREEQELLQSIDLIAVGRGYSGRARRRLQAAAVKTFTDPLAKLAFVMGLEQDDPAIRYGKRPGRPAKSGLW